MELDWTGFVKHGPVRKETSKRQTIQNPSTNYAKYLFMRMMFYSVKDADILGKKI